MSFTHYFPFISLFIKSNKTPETLIHGISFSEGTLFSVTVLVHGFDLNTVHDRIVYNWKVKFLKTDLNVILKLSFVWSSKVEGEGTGIVMVMVKPCHSKTYLKLREIPLKQFPVQVLRSLSSLRLINIPGNSRYFTTNKISDILQEVEWWKRYVVSVRCRILV